MVDLATCSGCAILAAAAVVVVFVAVVFVAV